MYEQLGAGNNWALGYDYGKKFTSFLESKINLLAQKVEFANGRLVKDVVVVMSAAGGTGSGLGSFVVEWINNNTNFNIMCIVIWPHKSGEVVLQSTNALLTISYL